MSTNRAVWFHAADKPLTVTPAPYPTPGPTDVIVRTGAVALNPVDFRIQAREGFRGPTILGSDLAGTVVAVGDAVVTERLRVGDRVCAHVHGCFRGQPAGSAFQEFVVVPAREAVVVSADVPLERVAVLPLCLATAAAALFTPGQLGLSTARLEGRADEGPAERETLLVWGGSSSVGCCAIQLAKAAGYGVIAMASPRNHDLCKSLGATKVFDYNDADVVEGVASALAGKHAVGALDCIGDSDTTTLACARILTKAQGQRKVMSVLSPSETGFPGDVTVQRLMIPNFIPNKVFDIVMAWMAKALANGSLQCKPDPRIVGTSLESIPEGIEILKKGVSAMKLVVRLEG